MSDAKDSAALDTVDTQTIVILGNGFDLACGLPTKYSDFITFLSCLEERWLEAGRLKRDHKLHPKIKRLIERDNPRRAWEHLFDNFWYRHFKKSNDRAGWVDFENEVARVIGAVEESMSQQPNGHFSDMSDSVVSEQHSLLETIILESKFSSAIQKSAFYILMECIFKAAMLFIVIAAFLNILGPILVPSIWPQDDEASYTRSMIIVPFVSYALMCIASSIYTYKRLQKVSSTVSYRDVLLSVIGELNPLRFELFDTKPITKRGTKRNGSRYNVYTFSYDSLRDYLLDDFNGFLRGLETYLRDFVETIESEPSPGIEELLRETFTENTTSRVICFNYTATFQRVCEQLGYSLDGVNICYIHGKLGNSASRNRMVLGIDERLTPDEQEHLVAFAPFRKYYQRIYKETDSGYIDWLQQLKEQAADDNKGSVRILVFGHSLGITDKDALVPFLKLDNATTKVFYHTHESFGGLVANLTALLGMNEVIRYTGGTNATIKFVQQKASALNEKSQ